MTKSKRVAGDRRSPISIGPGNSSRYDKQLRTLGGVCSCGHFKDMHDWDNDLDCLSPHCSCSKFATPHVRAPKAAKD